jgi:hypothetical protein
MDERAAADERIIRSRRERIDTRRWHDLFSGRRALLVRLETLLSGPPPQILTLSGVGGMGKSYALHSIDPAANERAAVCPHAWLNFQAGETDTHGPVALWSARCQLRQAPAVLTTRFDILYAEWYRRTEGRALERAQLLNHDLAQTIDLLGRIEGAPLLGYVAGKASWVIDLGVRIIDSAHERAVRGWFSDQAELAEEEWPRAFVQLSLGDLELLMPRALAADIADVGPRLAPGNEIGLGDRILIVIDTYERVADLKARGWQRDVPTFVEDLCAHLVKLKARVAVVVCGRDPTYWGWQLEGEAWMPDPASAWRVPPDARDPTHLRADTYEALPVGAFEAAELDEYLVERRGLPGELVGPVYDATSGYVLAVAIAADLLLAAPDRAEDALVDLETLVAAEGLGAALAARTGVLVERLLEQLERAGRRDLEALIRAAAIPRVFDGGLLYEMTGDLATPELAAELFHYSFVVNVRDRSSGGHSVHPVVRGLLLEQDAGTARQRDLHDAARRAFARRP